MGLGQSAPDGALKLSAEQHIAQFDEHLFGLHAQLGEKLRPRIRELETDCDRMLLVAEWQRTQRPNVLTQLNSCVSEQQHGVVLREERQRFDALQLDVERMQAALRERLDVADDLASKLFRVAKDGRQMRKQRAGELPTATPITAPASTTSVAEKPSTDHIGHAPQRSTGAISAPASLVALAAPPVRPALSAPPSLQAIGPQPSREALSAPPSRPALEAPPSRPALAAPLRRLALEAPPNNLPLTGPPSRPMFEATSSAVATLDGRAPAVGSSHALSTLWALAEPTDCTVDRPHCVTRHSAAMTSRTLKTYFEYCALRDHHKDVRQLHEYLQRTLAERQPALEAEASLRMATMEILRQLKQHQSKLKPPPARGLMAPASSSSSSMAGSIHVSRIRRRKCRRRANQRAS